MFTSELGGTLPVSSYLNAGGRGTRLNSLFAPDPDYGIAKALLEVGMPPTKLIDHHVAKMAQTAFWHTIVGAGDLQSVANYAYERYANNPDVTALTTGEYPQLGTAGDLIVAVRDCPELFGEHVVIKNCDTILDIEDREFVDFHVSRKSLVSIALTRKKGVPNEGAFFVDEGGRVV